MCVCSVIAVAMLARLSVNRRWGGTLCRRPKGPPFERRVLALDLKSDLSTLLDEAPWPADIKSAGNVVSTGQTREQAESGDGVGACDRSWPFCDVAADTPDVRLSM